MSNHSLLFTDIYYTGASNTKKVSIQPPRSNIEVKVTKRSKRSKKFSCQEFLSKK